MAIHDEFVAALRKCNLFTLGIHLSSGNNNSICRILGGLGLRNYSIECLSCGNSKIYKVTKIGESESFILKLEAWSMTEAIKTRFEKEDRLKTVVAPVYFNEISIKKTRIQVQPFCEGGTLESEALMPRDPENKISRALMLYRQVAEFYIALEENKILFPDGKPSNFTLNKHGKLQLTDMKTYAEATDGNLLTNNSINTTNYPLYIPIPPPRELIKVHARHFGMNLYGYLTGWRWHDFYYHRSTDQSPWIPKRINDYNFSAPVFQSTDGKRLANLIKNMISDNPNQRPSIKEALYILTQMHQNRLKESIEPKVKKLEDISKDYPENDKLITYISNTREKLQVPSPDSEQLLEDLDQITSILKSTEYKNALKALLELDNFVNAYSENSKLKKYVSDTREKLQVPTLNHNALNQLTKSLTHIATIAHLVNDYSFSHPIFQAPDGKLLANRIRNIFSDYPNDQSSFEETQDILIKIHQLILNYSIEQAFEKLELISEHFPLNSKLKKYISDSRTKQAVSSRNNEALFKNLNHLVCAFESEEYNVVLENSEKLNAFLTSFPNINLTNYVKNTIEQLQVPNLSNKELEKLRKESTQILKNYQDIQTVLGDLEAIIKENTKHDKLEKYIISTKNQLHAPNLNDEELKQLHERSTQILKNIRSQDYAAIQKTLGKLDRIKNFYTKDFMLNNYITKTREQLQVPIFSDKDLKQLHESSTQILNNIQSRHYASIHKTLDKLVEIATACTDDHKLTAYITNTRKELELPILSDENLKQLHEESTQILKNLESDEYKAIKSAVDRFRKIGTFNLFKFSTWFSVGMLIKAQAIENALYNLPLQSRSNLISDTKVNDVQRELARHRSIGNNGNLYVNNDDGLIIEKAAKGLQDLKNLFNKHKAKQERSDIKNVSHCEALNSRKGPQK